MLGKTSVTVQNTQLPFELPKALLAPEEFFRSKLFSTTLNANPIVSAAGPLLSLLERLNNSSAIPDITLMRNNIYHELQAFHCKLASLSQPDEIVAIAKYLISATIDELLGKNHYRIYGEWAEFKSFTPPSSTGLGPETYVFDIIHYLNERPNQYLDLIELAYFCLLAGFEGINHQKADGRQALDNLIESLYNNIQQYRVNKPVRLFNETPGHDVVRQSQKPLIITMAISVFILLTSLISTQIILNTKAQDVTFNQNTIAELD